MDKALLLILCPFVIWILIIAWLFYATFGSRRVNLRLKGLGISIAVTTSTSGDKNAFRSKETDNTKEA